MWWCLLSKENLRRVFLHSTQTCASAPVSTPPPSRTCPRLLFKRKGENRAWMINRKTSGPRHLRPSYRDLSTVSRPWPRSGPYSAGANSSNSARSPLGPRPNGPRNPARRVSFSMTHGQFSGEKLGSGARYGAEEHVERETQECTTACRPPRPSLVVRVWLGVDQNEQHPADLVAPIRPGVVGAALNQHVARSHERLVLVQDRPDFALEADGVVHGVRCVEARVSRRAVGRGLAVSPA